MKTSIWLSLLATACLGVAANAQPAGTTMPPMANNPKDAGIDPGPPDPAAPGGTAGPFRPLEASQRGTAVVDQSRRNDYLVYLRPAGCCSLIGCNGPVGSEIYLRNGVSFPTGTGIFARDLRPGYLIEGGLRSLFFNPEVDRAWVADFGVASAFFNSRRQDQVVLQNFAQRTTNAFGQTTTTIIPQFPVTVRALNQTYVNLTLGREYWLYGQADPLNGELKWRAGWDLGPRIGTEKVDLEETRHRTGFVYGSLAALHTDVEIPYGQAILQYGLRVEHSYVDSHVLQRQNDTNLSLFNVLFTAGIRY